MYNNPVVRQAALGNEPQLGLRVHKIMRPVTKRLSEDLCV